MTDHPQLPAMKESAWSRAARDTWKSGWRLVAIQRILGVAIGLVITYLVADSANRAAFQSKMQTGLIVLCSYLLTEVVCFSYNSLRAPTKQRNELRRWIEERQFDDVGKTIHELRRLYLKIGDLRTDVADVLLNNYLTIGLGVTEDVVAMGIMLDLVKVNPAQGASREARAQVEQWSRIVTSAWAVNTVAQVTHRQRPTADWAYQVTEHGGRVIRRPS